MNKFGANLKQLRQNKNLTQSDLADALNLSRSAISMYENGEREPDFETLEVIADFFNVDMNHLLANETDVHPTQEYDPDAIEILALLDRPDMHDLKMLFMKTGKLSPEDKEQIARILKATLPPDTDC